MWSSFQFSVQSVVFSWGSFMSAYNSGGSSFLTGCTADSFGSSSMDSYLFVSVAKEFPISVFPGSGSTTVIALSSLHGSRGFRFSNASDVFFSPSLENSTVAS